MVGAEAVRVAEYRGGRSPAERYRLVPLDTVAVGPDDVFRPRLAGDAPWPGSLHDPPPALVWPDPPEAELLDRNGSLVRIDRRGTCSGEPATVSIASGAPLEVVGWSGPWLVDERWWDAVAHRRRARLQVHTSDGALHLLTLEAQRWWLEATYD
ncbi:MAG: hypothetical protein R2698_10180 [Microthrixaceae bacterium]